MLTQNCRQSLETGKPEQTGVIFKGPAKSWLFVGFPYPHRPTHIEAGSHRLNALGVKDGRCLRVRLAGEARDTKYTFLLVRVLACFCGAVLVWALR